MMANFVVKVLRQLHVFLYHVKFNAYDEPLQNWKKIMVKLIILMIFICYFFDCNDLYVLIFYQIYIVQCKCGITEIICILFMLHDKFYISESKQNESPSQMFHIVTKNGF